MAKFQVRARTVDMLGRQQIAGIPTAISELFKNAHDAYARNVEVDYFRDDRLFILRDDGLGMTREDFEQRWLTLGTESKVGSGGLMLPPSDPDQPKRPVLGEKGIGRLAIAIIGSQVLVLSRARIRGKPNEKTIVAYLHWGFFELPGLNLEDVTIPVREFQGGTLPDRDDVKEMLAEAASTLKRLALLTDNKRIKEIQEDMKSFNADPLEYSKHLGNPSLIDSGCGTHFYIIPADTILDDDIDNREAPKKATRFEKHLIGFTNTMTPNHASPPMIARFRDHKDLGGPIELIGERAFFTPEEFKIVDHHFLGHFDEFGQFRGQVGIYQTKPENYVLNWSESDGQMTECGPFNLSFAYMQGVARDSLVPPEEHSRLKRKLDRHGGLYIYRDGIRVQPYGDSDYDWLDIERNRTLGAGYYFYSYRRMFGVIELGRDANEHLTEKAGREGFRENKAYRQFRSILMNFFLQTAGDFFREEGKFSDPHANKKGELNRNAEIRHKKEKQARQRKTKFQKDLQGVFTDIDELNSSAEAEKLLLEVQHEVRKSLASDIPIRRKAWALIRSERQARGQLHNLRKKFLVTKPRGVGLSRQLLNEWNSYQVQMEQLDTKVFKPAEKEIEAWVSDAAREAKVPLNDIVRLDTAVSEHKNDALKEVRRLQSEVDTLAKGITETVKNEADSSVRTVTQTIDAIVTKIEHMKQVTGDISGLTIKREEFVEQIMSAYKTESQKLLRLHDQLNLVNMIWEQDGYGSNELTEALEEELEELKTQRDADRELAQTGMAINTISHEFDKTVGTLRDGLRKLKAWSDANPELNSLYQDIRTSFDHLDEYLTLFTPLDRRLHRTRINVTGKQIYEFLNKLFQTRFIRHNVTFTATKKFLNTSIWGYPSSLYPPFINLVDNAIFWVQRNHDRPREITLDADGEDLLVRDNGPGVSARDRENIFAMNFSRKPGGRGMGLPISRETLSRVGLKLKLDLSTHSKKEGAVFRISPDSVEDIDQEVN